MNKAELIETLSKRLGDRKAATAALDSVLEEIQRAVAKGDRVALTGFGVFEKRVRNARTARNPRTGEAVKVKKTAVPSFRAGQGFKDVVTGAKKLARATAAKPVRETAGAGTTKSNGRAGATGGTTRKTDDTERQTVASGGKTTGTSAGRKSVASASTKRTAPQAPATKKSSARSASR